MIPAADLELMYDTANGFAVLATVGAETKPVHLRQGDADVLGDRIARDYTVRYRASDFTSLARGTTVTINAVAYKVLEVRLLDSGDEKIARISKT